MGKLMGKTEVTRRPGERSGRSVRPDRRHGSPWPSARLGLVLRAVLERHQPREDTRRVRAFTAGLPEKHSRLRVIGARGTFARCVPPQIASPALIAACTARLVAASVCPTVKLLASRDEELFGLAEVAADLLLRDPPSAAFLRHGRGFRSPPTACPARPRPPDGSLATTAGVNASAFGTSSSRSRSGSPRCRRCVEREPPTARSTPTTQDRLRLALGQTTTTSMSLAASSSPRANEPNSVMFIGAGSRSRALSLNSSRSAWRRSASARSSRAARLSGTEPHEDGRRYFSPLDDPEFDEPRNDTSDMCQGHARQIGERGQRQLFGGASEHPEDAALRVRNDRLDGSLEVHES